ncbi:hypothetical protein B0H14DRAFT_2597883 [Mycena olivaceomarginata]|nr:hypothetical protein B0H14DRAFT_2597883 [Mycena olivaceomarginata]
MKLRAREDGSTRTDTVGEVVGLVELGIPSVFGGVGVAGVARDRTKSQEWMCGELKACGISSVVTVASTHYNWLQTSYHFTMVSTRKKDYSFIASMTQALQKSLLEEAAQVRASFDILNDAVILTAEGELPIGNLLAVDQHALSIAQIPRIHTSDLDEFLIKQEESEEDEEMFRAGLPVLGDPECRSSNAASLEDTELDSAVYKLRSKSSVDWQSPGGEFIVPKFTAKRKYNEDKDQLGPIPEDWLDKDTDVQSVIEASVAEGRKKSSQTAHSMAVIVEVPEKSEGMEEDSKGKNIAAGECSDGFAAYLQEMRKEATGSKKKASAEKKKAKEKFSRSDSQMTHSGWFRATTSKSGIPPAPPNTPSNSSDSSSSSESSDSDLDPSNSSSD